MKGGNRSMDSASAPFWLASALVVVLTSEMRLVRSSSRSASAVTSFEESTRKRSS
ncbi:MAG: hypothetical protein WKF40_05065 [Thermoleophilaceae bacterium]